MSLVTSDYRRLDDFGTTGSALFARSARAVCVAGDGGWIVAGDQEIVVVDAEGLERHRWSTNLPAWSVAVDRQGAVWAGEVGQIEVFDKDGQQSDLWRDDEHFGLVTALAVDDEVLVADAHSRWIHRFDQNRRLLNAIGDRHRKGGFHIPNGVLDFAVDIDHTVVVANPGMHRVERYDRSGIEIGYFGRFGQHDPAGFPGCCNPTNLALGADSRVVVSEKAGPRIKIYDRAGELLTVVADGDDFDPECKNMDLAWGSDGRIGVVDPYARTLVVFAPSASTTVASVSSGAGT